MKKLIFIASILLLIFSVQIMAQSKEDKKAAKKAKKEAKEKEKEAALMKYVELANTKQWVMQAETVYDEKNNSYVLNSSMNFISLENEDVILQIAFQDIHGWTGSRGSTGLGNVSEYTVNPTKGVVKVMFTGKGANLGTVKFTVNIDASGMARAYLAWPGTGRLTMTGRVVHPSQANIFKDSTNY